MTKKLGEFEILLLMALVRLGEDAYGAEVHREIESRTGRSIVVGAVYTGLARLEHSGLISSTRESRRRSVEAEGNATTGWRRRAWRRCGAPSASCAEWRKGSRSRSPGCSPPERRGRDDEPEAAVPA